MKDKLVKLDLIDKLNVKIDKLENRLMRKCYEVACMVR